MADLAEKKYKFMTVPLTIVRVSPLSSIKEVDEAPYFKNRSAGPDSSIFFLENFYELFFSESSMPCSQ